MLRKKSGFTLIELMVVIVIIGVLASLAIPRFTEASDKAKVAEAPRIIASYQSAYLAAVAERGEGKITDKKQIIFDEESVNAASNWFTYEITDGEEDNTEFGVLTATPQAPIGKFGETVLTTTYMPSVDTEGEEKEGCFTQEATNETAAGRYIPNFKLIEDCQA